MKTIAYVVDYYEGDQLCDCYPDFCATRSEAEDIAPRFMAEPGMEWATRYVIREIEIDE